MTALYQWYFVFPAAFVLLTGFAWLKYSVETAFTLGVATATLVTLLFLPPKIAVVMLLGAFVGIIELIGRYRDAPFRALHSYGALLYIAVNVAASVGGLYLLQTVGADFLQETNPEKRAVYEVLIAGFASLTFLRSSIFKLRFNNADISVGPALLLDILLAAADRGVDRRRGTDRAIEVADAMKDVSFDKAISTLPPFCFGLMQNVTKEERNIISDQINDVRKSPAVDPRAKSLLMGLLLMNLVGPEALKEAVERLGNNIKYDVAPPERRTDSTVVGKLLQEARRAFSSSASRALSESKQVRAPRSRKDRRRTKAAGELGQRPPTDGPAPTTES